jgi:hypothetical protein
MNSQFRSNILNGHGAIFRMQHRLYTAKSSIRILGFKNQGSWETGVALVMMHEEFCFLSSQLCGLQYWKFDLARRHKKHHIDKM